MLDPFTPYPMHGSKSFTLSPKILVLYLVAGCQEKTTARCRLLVVFEPILLDGRPRFYSPPLPREVYRTHYLPPEQTVSFQG